MPMVSCVLPVYKAEKYLKKVTESIINQTISDYEIIFVDDGSPDNSGKICDELSEKYNCIKVIHKKNEGSGYARNEGVKAASGKYICFIDPDDYIDDNLMKDSVSIAEKTNSDIVVFGHNIIYENIDGSIDKTEKSIPILDGSYTYKEFIDNFYDFWIVNPSTVWGKLFRKDYLIQNNLWSTNQSVGQDAVFCLDVYLKGFEKITFIQKAYYEHVLRKGSAVDRCHKERYKCELNIANKFENFLNIIQPSDKRCKALLYERYIRVVTLEATNLAKQSNDMKFLEKINHLKKLASMPEINDAIRNINISFYDGIMQKIMLIMLKMHTYSLLLICKKLLQKSNWH